MAKHVPEFDQSRTKRIKAPDKPPDIINNSEGGQSIIAFTGERRNGLFKVLVSGKVIELSRVTLNVLIDLVLARAASETGYLQARPVIIFRLRKAIDEAVVSGAGHALIETGGTHEYRLTIPRNRLSDQVDVAPCFVELVAIGAVSESQASEIRQVSDGMKST